MGTVKSEPKYKKGDKVLCYEPDPIKQPIIYNSVILEVEHEDITEFLGKKDLKNKAGNNKKRPAGVQPIYLVHFQNWGSQYDRWVTEDLVLADTPSNLAIKDELEKQIVGAKNACRKRGIRGKPLDKCTDLSENPESKFKMDLNLPLTIKQALERDFVNVTLRNLLVNVPRTPNVETILAKFVEDVLVTNPLEDRGSLEEFTQGIITCFDFTLPLLLLYKEERSQLEREGFVQSGSRIKRQQLAGQVSGDWVLYPGYSSWGSKTDDQDPVPGPLQPSKLYGAEHLLRLFVKLPELLDHMETEYVNSVAYYCQTFLDFVARHRAEVFVEIQPYKEAELCDLG